MTARKVIVAAPLAALYVALILFGSGAMVVPPIKRWIVALRRFGGLAGRP